MENAGPGSRGTGSRGPGVWKTRGVENVGREKRGVWKTRRLVENTGSKWKTRGKQNFPHQIEKSKFCYFKLQ